MNLTLKLKGCSYSLALKLQQQLVKRPALRWAPAQAGAFLIPTSPSPLDPLYRTRAQVPRAPCGALFRAAFTSSTHVHRCHMSADKEKRGDSPPTVHDGNFCGHAKTADAS